MIGHALYWVGAQPPEIVFGFIAIVMMAAFME